MRWVGQESHLTLFKVQKVKNLIVRYGCHQSLPTSFDGDKYDHQYSDIFVKHPPICLIAKHDC